MLTENGVAYGPLEYAANGKVIKYSTASKVYANSLCLHPLVLALTLLCRLVVRGVNDASLTKHEVQRQSLKLARNKLVKELEKKASKSDKALKAFNSFGHRSLTTVEQRSLKRKADKLAASRRGVLVGMEDPDQTAAPKRRRLSADEKLVLQC